MSAYGGSRTGYLLAKARLRAKRKDREYVLLSNEDLMTSVQDAVYEGEDDD